MFQKHQNVIQNLATFRLTDLHIVGAAVAAVTVIVGTIRGTLGFVLTLGNVQTLLLALLLLAGYRKLFPVEDSKEFQQFLFLEVILLLVALLLEMLLPAALASLKLFITVYFMYNLIIYIAGSIKI